MRMMDLAWKSFKSSFKSYLSLILSLAFTILIFLNFQNLIFSDVLVSLGEHNREYIAMLVKVLSFVLGCFMFFFIGYSTNVFLTKRKKEIGTYIFMGLTNQKIGMLYVIEITLTGLVSLALGIFLGMLTTRLFQMILLAISEISVPLKFHFSFKPVLITFAVYMAMYLFFAVRGYIGIVKNSVLNLVSAAKQNEYVKQNKILLITKSVLGVGILCAGYYLSIKEGGREVMNNVLAAVILVTLGVYLLFSGFIPLVFQGLAGNKSFLYHKQRNLWVNHMIFRIKKNYRTYAIVCILLLCSVTALAGGFAMKYRYENMVRFRNTYTFQFMHSEPQQEQIFSDVLKQADEIAYAAKARILPLERSLVDAHDNYSQYAIISYSEIKELAGQTGLEFDLPEPADDEIIAANHLVLLSLITQRDDFTVTIAGKEYRQIEETMVPYMGTLQEMVSFFIVNDAEYERLVPFGTQIYTYNFRIVHPEKFEEARAATDELSAHNQKLGRISVDPKNSDIEWIKVLYSLAVFLFLVFILASGSILFMRLYNDAFEDAPRYRVLQKLGCSNHTLKRSIACELGAAYGIPFTVMAVSSYFSVHALEKMMFENLLPIQLISVVIVFMILAVCYGISLEVYKKNIGLGA